MNDNRSPLCDKPDYLVCTCMGIMYSDLCAEIENGVTTFDELSDMFGVGTGCSSCVGEIHEILKEHKNDVR